MVGLLLALFSLLPQTGDSADGEAASSGPRNPLTSRDAARTAAFTIVQGAKGCMEFPGFLWYFANSTQAMPLAFLDVYTLDEMGRECVLDVTKKHPSYVRRVVDMSDPTAQVRRKFRPPPVKGRHPRRLWPSNLYQYLIWVAYEDLLDEGMHVLHLDTDTIILRDLWTTFVTPVRAGYDIIATCDFFGPGRGRGCAFNPAVMLMRNRPEVLGLLSWLFAQWDEKYIDRATHRPANRTLNVDPHGDRGHWLSDMFMLNMYFNDCHRTPRSEHAAAEQYQQNWTTGVVPGENAWRCNNTHGAAVGPTYLATWKDGYLRHGQPKDCGDKIGDKIVDDHAEACRQIGISVYHAHAPGLYSLMSQGLGQPWPPAPPGANDTTDLVTWATATSEVFSVASGTLLPAPAGSSAVAQHGCIGLLLAGVALGCVGGVLAAPLSRRMRDGRMAGASGPLPNTIGGNSLRKDLFSLVDHEDHNSDDDL